MKFKLKAVMTFIILLLATLQSSKFVKAEGDYTFITSNKNYTMEFNEKTANVKFTNNITGTAWTTFPENWEEDAMSKGAVRENIASHIMLELYGTSDNVVSTNTYTQCVKKGKFTYDKLSEGLAVNYNLEKLEIKITIEFHLTETGFTVVVPPSKISEGETIISGISILPFICSGQKGEDGYLFVPDGSGMLVDFNDNYELYRNVTRQVYGRDFATNLPPTQLLEETYRLPVYGAKNTDKGVFAIIEEQAARASITTGIGGFMYSTFRNYCTMLYRDQNEIIIKNNSGVSTRYVRWSDPISTDMKISYYLLEKEQSKYSDMAAIYQNYLVTEKGMKKSVNDKASFDLTLIGSIKMKKSFLGFPITMNVPLTTFKQSETIISSLQNRGIENINVRFLGYNKNGYQSQWSESINPMFSLGGSKGLNKLIDFTNKNNCKLFLSGELITVNKAGNGFSISKDAVRTISNSVLQVNNYSAITQNMIAGSLRGYLTSPSKFINAFNGFIKEITKLSLNSIAFEDVGNMVYSDYNKNNRITRDKSENFIAKALDIPESIENVMFTGGNAYVLDKATHLMEVPLSGSSRQITSEYVPFYQMVIHGYINYSGEAFNLSSDRKKDMLKMIEYGANIHYYGIYEESSILKTSKITHILSACYLDWIDEASEMYRKTSIAYDSIYNKRMIDHYELEDNVFVTVYEGGTNIIVNYNKDAFRMNNNVVVNGMDFMVTEGGVYEK